MRVVPKSAKGQVLWVSQAAHDKLEREGELTGGLEARVPVRRPSLKVEPEPEPEPDEISVSARSAAGQQAPAQVEESELSKTRRRIEEKRQSRALMVEMGVESEQLTGFDEEIAALEVALRELEAGTLIHVRPALQPDNLGRHASRPQAQPEAELRALGVSDLRVTKKAPGLRLGSALIYDFTLYFTSWKHGKFQFTDASGDTYDVTCHINKEHHVMYNSDRPDIVSVRRV